ncbi:MAG: WD40 repeat domain-containing protein [Thermoplasmata archaeon]|nr:MAG: WD40 repeat domain-containing protein [Thermoplasmata archaeon]
MRGKAITVTVLILTTIAFAATPLGLVAAQQPPAPISTVDVAGDGAHIAIGYDDWVAYFDTVSGVMLWTSYVGRDVGAVVLSENGHYLAVASNDYPHTPTSNGYVSLYDTTDGSLIFSYRVDYNIAEVNRAIDITRDGQYIAVGTGVSVDQYPGTYLGSIYLFKNPDFGASWVKYYNANSRVHCVRFSGDRQHFAAGCYWHFMHFFDVPTDCTQPLVPKWTVYCGDPYYSIGISYNAERIATGHGWQHYVRLYDGSGNLLWFSPQQGAQRRITMSDDAQYFAVAQGECHPTDFNGFHYFGTAGPTPIWSFPTPDPSNYVDMSVFNAMYVVGASYNTVYQWGDGHLPPPISSAPEHIYVANGVVTDVSISYSGTIYAASDDAGYLYVFVAGVAGPNLLWSWKT